MGEIASGYPSIALLGGAGARRGRDHSAEIRHMRGQGGGRPRRAEVRRGAIDVAVETAKALELSGLYVAGRGASANTSGRYELDACLMDGATGRAGEVAALQGF